MICLAFQAEIWQTTQEDLSIERPDSGATFPSYLPVFYAGCGAARASEMICLALQAEIWQTTQKDLSIGRPDSGATSLSYLSVFYAGCGAASANGTLCSLFGDT